MFYGFAKINGSQFTILDSELDKPMGQVRGYWLTWYYFGFSKLDGNLIAFTQISGAMLLTFRRTTLLGACLLAPILANIVLIDILYGVDSGATLVAMILLGVVIALIFDQFKDLLDLFWTRQKAAGATSSAAAFAVKSAVRVAMVTTALGFTYWVANHNNRAPSPIDGAWEESRAEPADAAAKIPQRIYFDTTSLTCAFSSLRTDPTSLTTSRRIRRIVL